MSSLAAASIGSAAAVRAQDHPTAASLACFHCAQPVTEPGRFQVSIDGQDRPMCCAGCAAVASAIVDAGLVDYYRHRVPGAPGAPPVPPELGNLALFDEADVQARFVRARGETREATLLVPGMRCGACVWLIEHALAVEPGVVGCTVNFTSERATVRWDPAATRLSSLLARIAKVGYAARPFDASEREAQVRRASRDLLKRVFVAGLAMMQVMMYAIPAYTAAPGDIDPEWDRLMRWASLVLTTPVVLYSARPFFAGALRDVRARSAGMDVPVALGIGVAFAASVLATVLDRGAVYFDSVTMFVFLLLGARHLEWIARRRASRALDAIACAAPAAATRLLPVPAAESASGAAASTATSAPLAAATAAPGANAAAIGNAFVEETVPVSRLAPGDLVRIGAGERVPVDARVVEGRSAIDQSLLTGESLPVACGPGDELPGGAVNAASPLLARVLRGDADSALSTIERLIARAASEKPRIAQLADRVATWFTLGLLAFALLVATVWSFVDPAHAIAVSIAVLVVSCPCALSLATPAALAAATGALTRRGMLVTRGHALETLAGCSDVVFDKTGTLTEGRPRLVDVALHGGPERRASRERALAIAVALEAGASHPLADALRAARAERAAGAGDRAAGDLLVRAASDAPAVPAAADLQATPGGGVEGRIDGRRYRLGSAAFVGTLFAGAEPGRHAVDETRSDPPDASAASEPDDAASEVWLADEQGVLARFAFEDRLREDARQAVSALRAAGVDVHLVSGDRAGPVRRAAQALGIEQVAACTTPDGKLAYLRRLQRDGRTVLVVGDGINDAPVLAAADVSVAAGNASALAQTAADVVMLSPRVQGVVALLERARRTRRIVAGNLGWAAAYNAVAIPAAALGWVPPWLAALGMSASSLLVVGNALRLLRDERVARVPRAPAASAGAHASTAGA